MSVNSLLRIKNLLLLSTIISIFTISAPAIAANPPAKQAPAKNGKAGNGRLVIESSTTNAEVYIDGKISGAIPFKETSLSVGKHHVEIKKKGFMTYTNDINIVSGKNAKIKVDLLPNAAIVEISSVPPKAEIFINGKSRDITPAQIELKTGSYDIEIKLKDYIPFKKNLKIDKLGETIPVSATLTQDKLDNGGEDDLLLLPLDSADDMLPLDSLDEDMLPLEPTPAPAPAPATVEPDDDLLELELLPEDESTSDNKRILAPPPPSSEASNSRDGSSDDLFTVPAGVAMAGAANTATTKVHKDKKFYKTWWFWTITGAVVVGAAIGIGVGAHQAADNKTPERTPDFKFDFSSL